MDPNVRKFAKDLVRRKARVVHASVSSQRVSVVAVKMYCSGKYYEAVGTSKLSPSDVYCPEIGIEQAYEKAIVELTDELVGKERDKRSYIFPPDLFPLKQSD